MNTSKSRLRRLNRRQRKKLRLAEFQELIFGISVVFKNSLTLADWDEFIDDFCEYVDSRGLGLCGFGGQMPLSATEGWIQKRGHGSPTESQRQEVVTWLRNCPEVLAALPGVMIDAWY